MRSLKSDWGKASGAETFWTGDLGLFFGVGGRAGGLKKTSLWGRPAKKKKRLAAVLRKHGGYDLKERGSAKKKGAKKDSGMETFGEIGDSAARGKTAVTQ